MANEGGEWVAVVHYTSNEPRGGSWMTGVGKTRRAAVKKAVARHERILGAPPPGGSEVEYYRDDKWQGKAAL